MAINPLAESLPGFSFMAQALSVPETTSVALPTDVATWNLWMLAPIVFGAIGYMLIQHGVVKSKAATGTGIVAILAAVVFAFGFVPTTLESWMLMSFCTVATAGGVSFLVAREPVYAALGFATAVLSTCGILFMQSALFVAAATMIVYAGATIIIFLFVLMFAQHTDLRTYDIQLTNPLLAAAIGAVLLTTITMCVTGEKAFASNQVDATRPYSQASLPPELRSEKAEEFYQKTTPSARLVPSTTAGLGRALYTDYLIAVELAGTVLLVATIGALALAQRTTEEPA
jgi:NADH-quinone oxidoreductase subunit J